MERFLLFCNHNDTNKIPFLKGNDGAVEVLQHPFFSKVERGFRTAKNSTSLGAHGKCFQQLRANRCLIIHTVWNSQAGNSVVLEKKNLGGSEQSTGNQEKVSNGGGGLMGQNSPKANLHPRYSLWRPPLGGEIREVEMVSCLFFSVNPFDMCGAFASCNSLNLTSFFSS